MRVDPIIDGCPSFWQPVPNWGAVWRRLPDITVHDRLTAHVGRRRIELPRRLARRPMATIV
jgi:cyclase